MSQRITMQDIAQKAGVSASTVCRALKSSPQIPQATREHVAQVAQSLGYRPDPLLSAFASRRRGRVTGVEATTIAYVTALPTRTYWMDNSFYLGLFNNGKARAQQRGYDMEHFWLRETGMTGKRLSRILYSRGITGVFVAPLPVSRGHLSLDWDLFCSVTTGYSLVRPNLHRTAPHHFHGMQTVIRELRRLGYRRIGFCVWAGTSLRVDEMWLSAFLLAQRKLPQLKFSTFLFTDETLKDVPDWCVRENLEVVIGGGEAILLRELRNAGLFPDKLDYVDSARMSEGTQIAGIDQCTDEVAAATIDLIISLVQRGERGIPKVPMTTMVEGKWRPGTSLKRAGAQAG